jgi:hypothetical protein
LKLFRNWLCFARIFTPESLTPRRGARSRGPAHLLPATGDCRCHRDVSVMRSLHHIKTVLDAPMLTQKPIIPQKFLLSAFQPRSAPITRMRSIHLSYPFVRSVPFVVSMPFPAGRARRAKDHSPGIHPWVTGTRNDTSPARDERTYPAREPRSTEATENTTQCHSRPDAEAQGKASGKVLHGLLRVPASLRETQVLLFSVE